MGKFYARPIRPFPDDLRDDGWTYVGWVDGPVRVEYDATELGVDLPLSRLEGREVTGTFDLPTGWWERQRLLGIMMGVPYRLRWRERIAASTLMSIMMRQDGYTGTFQALVHASGRMAGTARLHRAYRLRVTARRGNRGSSSRAGRRRRTPR